MLNKRERERERERDLLQSLCIQNRGLFGEKINRVFLKHLLLVGGNMKP